MRHGVIVASEVDGLILDYHGILDVALMPCPIAINEEESVPSWKVNIVRRISVSEPVWSVPEIVNKLICHFRVSWAESTFRPIVTIISHRLRVLAIAPSTTVKEDNSLVSTISITFREIEPRRWAVETAGTRCVDIMQQSWEASDGLLPRIDHVYWEARAWCDAANILASLYLREALLTPASPPRVLNKPVVNAILCAETDHE